MIIFISGPITGVMNYREKFKVAVRYLEERGHIALNPALIPSGLKDHKAYMNICLAMLNEAEAIYMLKGWENSTGAVEVHNLAVSKGLRVFRQEDEEWTYITDGEPRDNAEVKIMTNSGIVFKAEYIYDESNGTTYFRDATGYIVKDVIKWRYV